MALADTAELAVRLTLDDRFSRGIGNVERRLGRMEKGIAKVGRGVSTTSRVMGTFGGIVLDRVVSGGIRSLTTAFRDGTASLEELEAVSLRTATALKSTGGVSGQTSKSIRDLAESMEELTTFDDKAIQGAENMLLTFTNVRKKAFKPALEAILDLNAALGKGDEGLQGTAILVGKALNDPARGLTALRRVGVSFTKQQEDQIKSLVKQNKLFAAQQIILGELNKEFGGQGATFGKGAAADARRFRDALEDLQVVFARGLAPAVENIRKGLTAAFASPRVVAAVDTLSKRIASFVTPANVERGVELFTKGMEALADIDFKAIGDGLRITGQAAKVAVDAFLSLPPDVQKIAIAALAINKLSGGVAGAVAVKGIEALLGGLKTIIAGNVTVVGKNVVGGGAGVPATGGGGRVAGIVKTAAAVTVVGLAAGAVQDLSQGLEAAAVSNKAQGATREELLQAIKNLESTRPATPFGLDLTGRAAHIDEMIAQLRAQLDAMDSVAGGVRTSNALLGQAVSKAATVINTVIQTSNQDRETARSLAGQQTSVFRAVGSALQARISTATAAAARLNSQSQRETTRATLGVQTAVRKKDLSVDITVNNSVSIRDQHITNTKKLRYGYSGVVGPGHGS